MTTINRTPAGLLAFLDVKTMGRNPPTLGQFVQPTLDLTNWYMNSAVSTFRQTAGNPTWAAAAAGAWYNTLGVFGTLPGPANQVRVPQNEYWYMDLWATHMQCTDVAGDIDLTLGYSDNGVFLVPTERQGLRTVTGAPQPKFLSFVARDFWVAPGAYLGFLLTGVNPGAGTITATTNFQIGRFLI